jgi:hypothetical protein
MDQARAVNPTRRREKRVGMSLFTWAIDIACHNGYCIMKKMMPKANVSLREYKRQLSVLLTEPHRLEREAIMKRSKKSRPVSARKNRLDVSGVNIRTADCGMGASDTDHYLLENKSKRALECFLCRIIMKDNGVPDNKIPKSIYGCSECGKGFHVNCFTAYHCRGSLQHNSNVLNKVISALEKDARKRVVRDKVSAKVSTLQDIKIYCQEHLRNN